MKSAHRDLSIVVGYVVGVDRCPPLARRHRLTHRFAFVLHTFRPEHVDMYFDRDLHGAILAALWRIVAAERADARDEETETRCDSVGALLDIAELRDEPLLSVTFYDANDTVTLVVESEPWAYTGGPSPYHDSFTLAAFSALDLSRDFSRAATEIAQQLGGTVLDTVTGQSHPPSLRHHLAALLRRQLRGS